MKALNSPVELGMRTLVLLNEIFPESLDIGHLIFCDHALLHSAELGGPASIHPKLPAAPGELGIKRRLVESGLRVMIRAGLVEMVVSGEGIEYKATDQAASFVDVLEAEYLLKLKERAQWVAMEFAPLSAAQLRDRMSSFFTRWSEEFFDVDMPTGFDEGML
ncbi:ABC-three component system middle component 2 [Umezawaea sp. Da 62-37]|uniref:ABC-three component system middle component 2 n=1 Tax=Umezawaea sp. Da 62-37 TaxID=3075927 RepID=UPI0028F7286D|nr:ABC-three component system middle component 2 [Umezawaea sp. Da 62-37]WNV82150.1 threonine transporter [Umezawaea sp. Da 62-37]